MKILCCTVVKECYDGIRRKSWSKMHLYRGVDAQKSYAGTTVMVALFTNSFNDVEWLSVNAERFDVVFNSSNDLAPMPTIIQVSSY